MTISSFGVDDVHGVFCDAAVRGSAGELVFASLWGRDTAIQGLLGRLELGFKDDGLACLKLVATDTDQSIPIDLRIGGMSLPSIEAYDKVTGRMQRVAGIHGTIVHLMLYDKRVRNLSSGKKFVLARGSVEGRLWDAVRAQSPYPLLGAWEKSVLDWLSDQGCITPLPAVGLNAWEVNLVEQAKALEAWIGEALRTGSLEVPSSTSH